MKSAKKSLGQNFLVDRNVIRKIISLSKITNENIFEIGPGSGALTDEILKKKPKSLIIIEKDFELSKKLKFKYSDNKKIRVINGDILDIDIEKLITPKATIFGNLPYNISSQILVKFILDNKFKFKALIFMFQKEMANRILAHVNSKDYGRLSIISNWKFEIKRLFDI